MAEPGNPNALQDRHRCGIVAIIGPPNAGKSTLLNHFLGEKLAIVTPKPQTTRNRISGILSRDEAQIIFLDTPGIHYSRQTLNSFLVETAWQALESADAILSLYWMPPGTAPLFVCCSAIWKASANAWARPPCPWSSA